jgi:hypothetical protein
MTQNEFKMNSMFLANILAFLGTLPFLLSLLLKLSDTFLYGNNYLKLLNRWRIFYPIGAKNSLSNK